MPEGIEFIRAQFDCAVSFDHAATDATSSPIQPRQGKRLNAGVRIASFEACMELIEEVFVRCV